MKRQVLTLVVHTDEENDDPVDFDWTALTGETVVVIAAGPVQKRHPLNGRWMQGNRNTDNLGEVSS